jgi:hypothetical protein
LALHTPFEQTDCYYRKSAVLFDAVKSVTGLQIDQDLLTMHLRRTLLKGVVLKACRGWLSLQEGWAGLTAEL